jgi:hypothetical protein
LASIPMLDAVGGIEALSARWWRLLTCGNRGGSDQDIERALTHAYMDSVPPAYRGQSALGNDRRGHDRAGEDLQIDAGEP